MSGEPNLALLSGEIRGEFEIHDPPSLHPLESLMSGSKVPIAPCPMRKFGPDGWYPGTRYWRPKGRLGRPVKFGYKANVADNSPTAAMESRK